MCVCDHSKAQVRGPNEKLTLSEIHHIHDTKDQGQPQSDSDIDAPEKKAINQVIEEHTSSLRQMVVAHGLKKIADLTAAESFSNSASLCQSLWGSFESNARNFRVNLYCIVILPLQHNSWNSVSMVRPKFDRAQGIGFVGLSNGRIELIRVSRVRSYYGIQEHLRYRVACHEPCSFSASSKTGLIGFCDEVAGSGVSQRARPEVGDQCAFSNRAQTLRPCAR